MRPLKMVLLGVVLLSGSVLSLVAPLVAVGEEMDAVSPSEQQALLEEVVTPFLEALQAGDVPALEQLIGGKLGLTLGPLLRQNAGYPDFLRQRYGGTTVQEPIQMMRYAQVGTPASASEGHPCVAEVYLQHPAGRADHFQLHLEQDAQGAWKVMDKQQVR